MKTNEIIANKSSFLEVEGSISTSEKENLDILSTLESVILLNTAKKIELKSYYDSTLNYLLEDSRFSYRIFRLISFNDGEFFGFIDRMTILNLAILSLINDFEYKNPIDITIEKHENVLRLAYEVMIKNKRKNDFLLAKKADKNISDKETYIACLCNQDGNSYDISISERKLTIALGINEQISEDKELSCEPFSSNEKELISRYLNVFFKPIDIAEAEIEEEAE